MTKSVVRISLAGLLLGILAIPAVATSPLPTPWPKGRTHLSKPAPPIRAAASS